MGFFDVLRDTLEANQKIIKMKQESTATKREEAATKRDYQDLLEDEEYEAINSRDYRKTAFKNTPSNNGWFTCPQCGKKFRASEMDVDHIVPQSRGGTNSIENLQLLCAHCNRSKGNDTSNTKTDSARRKLELDEMRKLELELLNSLSDEDLDL